ncbi:hypothetical protein MNBD_GAMMA24-2409 [hydrothermal vent metagenome]|uniref:Uncharacterized protein n=1 Tax=hydrothermal vent metagenome TaxID=652676 RepID=A0A3B1BLT5_9ZZZZ
MLIILILISIYFAWLAFSLRKLKPAYSLLAGITAIFTGFLALGGFFGFL